MGLPLRRATVPYLIENNVRKKKYVTSPFKNNY
jgi:hypothetical protein